MQTFFEYQKAEVLKMDSMRYLPPDLREILGDDSDLDNVSPKKVTQNSYFNGAHSKGILSTPTRNIISLTPPELTIPSSVDFGFRSTINNANTVSPQPSKLFATRPPRFPPGLVPKNAFLFSNETDDQTDADLCHLTSRVERKLTFSDQGSVSSDTCSIFAPFKNEKEAVLRPRAHSSPVCDNPAVKQSGKGKKKKRTKPNTNKRSSSSSSSSLTASKQPEEDKKKTLYKTEICRSYEETGKCKFDDRCLFAHGKEELREVKRHPRYKTEICRSFWEDGNCKYGRRCCFLHMEKANEVPQGHVLVSAQARVDQGETSDHAHSTKLRNRKGEDKHAERM